MINARPQVRFIEKTIDRIFERLDTSHLPGAAVGIAIGGRPAYRKGFGLASMELPVTLTSLTRMRIYSITKHFICLAYLLFCEEGKAHIDDPIQKYFPDLHPIAHRVTMRQLMSNTSGLRDACEIRWMFSGIQSIVPASELFALYRDMRDGNCAPGEAWCYNNGGFHILSAVIEKVADQRLEEVLSKRIFEPVGMYDTLLRRVDTDFIPNSATMHMTAVGGGYQRKYLPGELLGEGGIVSTVDDMLRWLKQMAKPIVGDANTWGLLCAPQKLRNGAETGYGLGLLRGKYRGTEIISHSGAGLGSNSQMIKLAGGDLDVVVVANRHDVSASDLAASIVDACLGVPPAGPNKETSAISGVFSSPRTGRVMQFYQKNGRQKVLVDGMEEWPLNLTDDKVLRIGPLFPSNVALRLVGNPSKPESIQQEYFGSVDDLLPIREDSSRELGSISAEFRAESIGVRMSVAVDGATGRAATVGHFGSRTYRLDRIGGRLWRMNSDDATEDGGILAIDSGATEAIFRTARTWALSFKRS